MRATRARASASEGISVYSPHTAIDATPGGMADWLCDIVTGAITSTTPTKPTLTQSSSATYSHPVYPAPQPATQATKVPKHTRHTILPSPPPLPEGVEDTAGMGRIVTFTDPEPLTAIVDRIAQGVGFPGGIPIAIPQPSDTRRGIWIRRARQCGNRTSGARCSTRRACVALKSQRRQLFFATNGSRILARLSCVTSPVTFSPFT